jgi:hypothetical protein
MDSLDLSHVTVRSISNQQFSIPIKVETVENIEEITALIDSGAEGLFIDKSIAHKWRTNILKSPIKVRNVDGTYNENGAITERCLRPFRINDRIMTEWFYVTALGDQNLILGLPWLEKHNPIIDWTEKTLEFRNSQEDKAKAFIWSLARKQEETMLIEDKDLVVWYLKSHRGPEPSDQLYTPFEDIGQWNEEQPNITIRKYSPAQQMEQKYNAKQEESILLTQYLPWKEVFEQKAAERFPGKRPWDHAIELRDNFKLKKGKCYNTVRTPTLCKPDTLDRPYYFPFNLLNLATPLTTYAVRLVLLIFVPLSSLPCYLYDAVLILTSDILYSLIDMFLSILRYISTHVFVVEP